MAAEAKRWLFFDFVVVIIITVPQDEETFHIPPYQTNIFCQTPIMSDSFSCQ
jgi:hypothetical protein